MFTCLVFIKTLDCSFVCVAVPRVEWTSNEYHPREIPEQEPMRMRKP